MKPSEYRPCTEKDLVNYAVQDGYGEMITEDDIAVRKYSVNFAQGDKDPFDFVRFYNQPNYKGIHTHLKIFTNVSNRS